MRNYFNEKKIRLNQYLGAFIVSMGGFALGVSLAWNSRGGIQVEDLNAITIEMSLVGFMLNIGACFGVICVPLFLRIFNYTGTMFMTVPLFLIGWAFICFARAEVTFILIGRSICGFCGGIFCVLTPLYIAEIADKEIRNRLLTFFQLLINCGILYAFLVAYLMEEHNTVWQYSSICAISCAPIALVNLLPESSLYHLSTNDESRAIRSLKWYKIKSDNLNQELEELKSLAVISKRKVAGTILKNKKVWQSFFACFGAMLIQQLSMINMIISSARSLFKFGRLSGNFEKNEGILFVGVAQIISCIVASILVDWVGRKVLLAFSTILMGIYLVFLGWFIKLLAEDPEYEDSWMAPTWMALYCAAFNLGVGPLSWSLHADTFPVEIKFTGAIIVAFFSWSMSLVAIVIFMKILIAYGTVTTLWAFAIFFWISGIILLLFIQETKGKSLAEIQRECGTQIETEN